ncbi:MAG: NUDIX hydrolase [Magnetococcales bacterium]|nr:NUDIX hydrolase [Magnetococcales bacterium]
MREYQDCYYEQSAVVPVRGQGDGLQILMITSRTGKRWIIPKGVIEPHLSPANSAAKEALEEAGIRGDLLPEMLGTYRYEKWGDICHVQVYVMQVTEVLHTWLEDFRQRAWVDLEDAVGRVRESALQEMLLQLPDYLEQNRPS